MNELKLPENPEQWISDLDQPEWDAYFMADVFRVCLRSPDKQTKQGCVVVDWDTKTILGTGYNGFPRKALDGLPTVRADTKLPDGTIQGKPDKYPAMVHCEINAMMNSQGTSDNAVMYLTMPNCETCLGAVANHPFIKVKRIVYLEHRDLGYSFWLASYLPHIKIEQYKGQHPADVLMNAAIYAKLRSTSGESLSNKSAKTYR